MFSSSISLWILFPDADTAHDDVFVVVDADDDLPPFPPPDIIIITLSRLSLRERDRHQKTDRKRVEMSKRTVLCPEENGDKKRVSWVWKLPLSYQSQVSILGPVGYGPTTLPLRHSDLLIT
jgi:hypothetical protein